jgi:hypothetical protein
MQLKLRAYVTLQSFDSVLECITMSHTHTIAQKQTMSSTQQQNTRTNRHVLSAYAAAIVCYHIITEGQQPMCVDVVPLVEFRNCSRTLLRL